MLKKLFISALASSLLASTALAENNVSVGDFKKAMESAYVTNPRIEAQRRTLEQANEQVSQAIGAFRPSVSGVYQRGRQRSTFDENPEVTNNLDSRILRLRQPLFLGGSNIYNYSATKDRMLAGRAQLGVLEQEVLLDAVIAYMDVVQNFFVLELSRNNVKVLDRQLVAAKDRFSVGDVTRTDVAQSKARLSRAQSDKIQAEGDLEIALAEFERVIGSRPETLPLPLPTSLPPLPSNQEEAVEIALERNPNVFVSMYAKEAAEDDVGVATASLLPQVTLQAEVSRQEGVGVFGNSSFDSDQVLVNVDIPIYQNGSEYSQVRSAELLEKQREYELLDTRQAVREALIQAWESLDAATATITAQQEQAEAAEIALDGVRQENQYGTRTVLEVLDAEQELFVARVNVVRAQRDRYVSLFNLMLILGQLNAHSLGLDVPIYDPEEHYDDVKWQLLGF